MKTSSEESILQLLKETLAAHSVYETTVLAGIYDSDWADWYATYMLEHGMTDLFPIDIARLSAVLTQLEADFRQVQQPEGEWPEFYARRLCAMAE